MKSSLLLAASRVIRKSKTSLDWHLSGCRMIRNLPIAAAAAKRQTEFAWPLTGIVTMQPLRAGWILLNRLRISVIYLVPGGLTSREVLDLIQALPGRLVGMDAVEVNPNTDLNDQTAILAAKCLHEAMGIALRQSRSSRP